MDKYEFDLKSYVYSRLEKIMEETIKIEYGLDTKVTLDRNALIDMDDEEDE